DQNDTAARVVYHGAGIRLSPKASPTKIRKTVESVLGDERFRTAAARLASAIADEPTPDVVAQLESLAQTTTEGSASTGKSTP
ncbi:MAG TPA: nucleotide disphospho-sugar-binding domain-containing protein, partial [Acidimicrobiales bacterium]|nr:nucleotide disphospho-sugar-binding domain-containing protein [Acidimicrobiales bacterium]